eukprot:CAMPEP_0172714826 /NCGR_PEP_ID=MMETSP1074-20121228/66972_1 /TAXON_ID=2916 /ORGANISM="Ceratium fusus, Strain PA161109" /LENGTH=120 /DNA_ID=CAMNT_0013539333 /DNA_START=205 /DNA_END=567 /DNA_ORIENTATION=+
MEKDPDVKKMMEDIRLHGPAAVEKHIANEELMVKMGRVSDGSLLAGPIPESIAAGIAKERSGTGDARRELRRRRQQLARQTASEEKKIAKQEQFERQRACEDAEAWEAMKREMQAMDHKS